MGRLFVSALMAGVLLLSACSPIPAPRTPSPSGSSAPTGSASPSGPVASPSATPSPTPAPDCDFLPAGVDPRACGVPGAVEPPIPTWEGAPGVYSFVAGGGEIRCDANEGGKFVACAFGFPLATGDPAIDCEAGDWDNNFVYLWQDISGGWVPGQGSCRSDALVAETHDVPTLPEEALLVVGGLAMIVGPTGITVWHGAARHGFAVSDDQVVTW